MTTRTSLTLYSVIGDLHIQYAVKYNGKFYQCSEDLSAEIREIRSRGNSWNYKKKELLKAALLPLAIYLSLGCQLPFTPKVTSYTNYRFVYGKGEK